MKTKKYYIEAMTAEGWKWCGDYDGFKTIREARAEKRRFLTWNDCDVRIVVEITTRTPVAETKKRR
jgi:hypothetical protein